MRRRRYRRRTARRGGQWWKGILAGWALAAVLGGVIGQQHHHAAPAPGPSWYQVAGTMHNTGQGAPAAKPARHAAKARTHLRAHARVPYAVRPHARVWRPWRGWWLRRARRAVLGF